MKDKIKKAVQEYQCTGCVSDWEDNCYKRTDENNAACLNHQPGTLIIPNVGRVYLGLPHGFNRLGSYDTMKINVFEKFSDCNWDYSKWNIPVWKHLNDNKHTLVRGLSPRINTPFLHIFLENCMDKIDCIEITKDDVTLMD